MSQMEEIEGARDLGEMIIPPIDVTDVRSSFYGAIACDAFKRAEHHEFDVAAYAVMIAVQEWGFPDDIEEWKKRPGFMGVPATSGADADAEGARE